MSADADSYLHSVREYFVHHDAITWWPPTSSTVVYSIILLLSYYYLLAYFNILPFTFSGAVSNSILSIIQRIRMQFIDQGTVCSSTFNHFRAKSEAVQRILGLGTNSFLASLPSASGYSMTPSSLFASNNNVPPGLGNWDNSCYQNSIIQSLASLHSLRNFLDHNIETLGDRNALATHAALKNVVERLNSSSNGGRKLWIPLELKSMSSWQQQDAQEYFSKVVDELDKEIRCASKGLTHDVGFKIVDAQRSKSESSDSSSLERAQVSEILGKLQSKSYSAPFENPLEGLLAQRVGCIRCGWTDGISLFQFNCLTVSLGRKWEYDIYECLDDYTSLEPIEGVECAKCTLLRTKAQLQQILEQFDAGSDSENSSGTRTLSDALKDSAESRLNAVQVALANEDFSEKTLSKDCHIPSKNRVSTTKSRQAVIARTPKSLAIHVNRSVFDELTGTLRKNYADVKFPKILDLDEWCLGTRSSTDNEDKSPENWALDPSESMLRRPGATVEVINNRLYELRAVITHYGRHENGHYICYRKYPLESFPVNTPEILVSEDGENEGSEQWFRLSDEDVSIVSESNVLAQGGVFMLFYELLDEVPPSREAMDDVVTEEQRKNELDAESKDDGISLEDISRMPPNDMVEEGPRDIETEYPENSATSDIFDVSSSSTSSSEDTLPERSSQDVVRVDMPMRTSSGGHRAESPSSVSSPMSPPSIIAN